MQIGTKGKKTPEGIAELLLECHQRIRSFVDLAVRLAEVKDAPDAQIRDAARQVLRYFEEALPLHVQDEEQSVLPRLRGRDERVDAALEKMREEHASHQAHLEDLKRICRALAETPESHSELSAPLAQVAAALSRDFEVHLRGEEETVIPAIGRLISAKEQANMILELRERRAPPLV